MARVALLLTLPMPAASRAPKVLVFDSGLGGLTVAREIQTRLPRLELLYYADTAFFPYGIRDEQELLQRVADEVLYLQRQLAPEIIVLACNTASTLVLPQLRAKTDTPIVGVVPAVKPAAENSNSGVIGLLATPGTVLRQYTAELIRQYAGHCEVVSVGSNELVQIAEDKMRGEPVPASRLKAILKPFRQHPAAAALDTVVLACTHFPLLKAELQVAYGREIHWLDSGQAIARRVESLLRQTGELKSPTASRAHRLLCSAPLPRADKLRRQLAQLGFTGPPQVVDRFACK